MCPRPGIVDNDRMGRRVLIVDDDSRFRELLRALLEGTGDYEVVGEAPEGETALDVAREQSPDLVLLDVNLPDTTGFELAPKLAGAADGPDVVMISSRDDDGYPRMAEEAGAAGFVSKHDLSPATLSAVLDSIG
jgi:DNA-binding NarL/FixJ family response regulator